MSQYCVGIDPGASGGIAWFAMDAPNHAQVIAMPGSEREVVSQLRGLLLTLGQPYLCIEQAGGRLGNSMQSVVTYMRHYGILLGTIIGVDSLDISRTLEVAPQAWQQAVGIASPSNGMDSQERRKLSKQRSRERCIQLFPHTQPLMDGAGWDGRSDALLIAYFAAQMAAKGWPIGG